MDSPCNKICKIDDYTDFCIGCGRNLDEIAEWSAATGARKQQILDALPARMAAASQRKSPADDVEIS